MIYLYNTYEKGLVGEIEFINLVKGDPNLAIVNDRRKDQESKILDIDFDVVNRTINGNQLHTVEVKTIWEFERYGNLIFQLAKKQHGFTFPGDIFHSQAELIAMVLHIESGSRALILNRMELIDFIVRNRWTYYKESSNGNSLFIIKYKEFIEQYTGSKYLLK